MYWESLWSGNGGLRPGQLFDKGCSSPALLHLLQTVHILTPGTKTALVPGCGRGYDVIELSKCGFNAVGVDLSTTAVAAANELSSTIAVSELKGGVSYYVEDILSPSKGGAVRGKKFDLIYDYTFLCALDPSLRTRWASTMKELVKPDGELVTLIYPLGDYEGGPPYAMSVGLVRGLLEAVGFEPFYLEPVAEALSHPGREGREALGRWKLKS